MTPLVRALARLTFAAGAAVGAARSLPAQQAGERGAVWGTVADQFGQPVTNAEVLLVTATGTAPLGRTVEAGTYRVDSLPAGRQQLRIRRLGYLPFTASIDLAPGGGGVQDFSMVKLPFGLDPALVQTADGELRASLASFAERRALGRGAFIDRAGIDALNPRSATDLMRAVKSFRLQPARGGGVRLVSASADGGPCTIRFLVDGVPYAPVDGLNDFDPEHIGALEAYGPGEAPAPLDREAGSCGTVVVWLRR
ncbi:MAG: hypothetical protein AVDCRST_MAG40-818 [uncultured Gemmatimonadaceae bacterium]|uniref:TonB-dependent receptor plug domain-containing protein n=1 Tax=uncultured Gemmatimonadaceae bacterium TaxID=246130 RepID=A0A6J4KJZ6_9BACT|nr:MAG: hypothetical protein AVDCRST_MAG40-818 [uncultured Gemmatimonadaceae bacterium]